MMRAFIIACALAAAPAPAAYADQFEKGQALYGQACAECHGKDGRGGTGYPTPIWGEQTQIQKFNNAQGLFEYIQLLMPFDDPAKISDAEKWDILQYMLANHGAVSRDNPVNAGNAGSIKIE